MVLEASVPTVHVWAHGLSCETPVAFAKCQEQFYNRFDSHKTSEKVNDQLLQILLVSRKKASNTTEIPRDDAPSHLRDPHLLALTFSGLLFVLFVLLLILLIVAAFLVAFVPVAACCCRCFCCCLCLFLLLLLLLLLLLGRRPSNPHPSHLSSV